MCWVVLHSVRIGVGFQEEFIYIACPQRVRKKKFWLVRVGQLSLRSKLLLPLGVPPTPALTGFTLRQSQDHKILFASGKAPRREC